MKPRTQRQSCGTGRSVPDRSAGLTLVELMVALLLSLLLLAGVVQLFLANKTTYRTQEGLARLQESGRFAMHELTRALRSAGYFGCANLELAPPQIQTASPPVDAAIGLDLSGPVIEEADRIAGLDRQGGDAMPGYAVAGDVLTLTGAGASGVGYTNAATPLGGPIVVTAGFDKFTTTDFILITDCEGTDLVDAGSGVSGGGTTIALGGTPLSKEFGADALVMRAYSYTYYIGDTGRDNAAGQDILALFRQDNFRPTGDPLYRVELIEGVSDMQVSYGVTVNGATPFAQAYVQANQVVDWGEVVAVRISLLVDSIEPTLDLPAGYNFDTDGDGDSDPVAATAGDLRMRQEFVVMSTLRNVAQ